MRKIVYLFVVGSIGSVLTNLAYSVPQMPWQISVICLVILCLVTVKMVRHRWAVSFSQRDCLLLAGLIIAPLSVSLAIRWFGDPNSEIAIIPTTWLRSVYYNRPWILANCLPETGVVVKQDWLVRFIFVQAGSWMMIFIFRPRRRKASA